MKTLFAVLLLATAGSALPATYYVATTGNDTTGNGTSGNPWATVQKGVTAATSPGDIVTVANGTYTTTGATCGSVGAPSGDVVTVTAVGTSGNPITIQATNPGQVTLDAQETCAYYFLTHAGSDYIVITGFNITGGGTGGVNLQGNHGTVQINQIYGNGAWNDQSTSGGHVGVITLNGTIGNVINRNAFHDNGRTNTTCGGPPCTPRDHDIYDEATGTLISNSLFYNPPPTDWTITIKNGQGAKIYNNTFYGNQTNQGRQGHIVIGDGTGSTSYSNFDIENDIFLDPVGTAAVVVCWPTTISGTNTLRNNIAFGPGVTQVWNPGPYPASGTGQVCGTSGTISGTVTDSNEQVADPQLANASAYSLTLLPTSPAINAGNTLASVTTDYLGVPRPRGANYDIGAYEADLITITSPGAGTPTISGGYGFGSVVNFTVAASGADIVKVCYTIDGAYPLYNPGIDAATANGCSLAPPFSIPVNTYWYPNAPHTVVANAYNALGAVVATSAAVPFTTSNTWPTSGAITSVTASTSFASPWSGGVTITANVSGTGSDQLTMTLFVDGIPQFSGGTTPPLSGTIQTTQFQNGTHNVCLNVVDNTLGGSPVAPNGTAVHVDTKSTWTAEVGDNCNGGGGSPVTFANGTMPAQALIDAHEVYLAPGGQHTFTAQVLNTDGTLNASTPVCEVAKPNLDVYIDGTVDVSLLAPINGYQGTSVASLSGCTLTALANGFAIVNVMTPTAHITDLQPNSNPIFIKSATGQYTFTVADQGKLVRITSCAGTPAAMVLGTYQIAWVQGGLALIGPGGANTPANFGGTGSCTGDIGPTRQALVYVWPTNNYPSYGSGGQINSTYDPSTSMFVNELFTPSFQILQEDRPYYSSVNSAYMNPAGLPGGVAVDFGVSSFNGFEVGSIPTTIPLTGAESASTWTTNFPPFITSLSRNGLEQNTKFKGLSLGSPICSTQSLYALTYGNESSPTYIGGNQTGMEYAVSQLIASGKVLGMTFCDELDGGFATQPLGGPYTFSASGTNQSGLEEIVCVNSGTCAVVWSPTSPPLGLIGGAVASFAIVGSSVSGMNSTPGSHYSVLLSGGATGSPTVTAGAVTVTVTNGGNNYYTPPSCSLLGGGGTYVSCSTAVNTATGKVSSVTISGSQNYVANPIVVIGSSTYENMYNFAFSAPGVANGCYNANGANGCTADPGLSIEPYVDNWYASNTSYMHYDSWAKWAAQMKTAGGNNFFFQTPQSNATANGTANWNGNASWPYAQSIGGVTQAFTAGEAYWQTGTASYLMSRSSGVSLIQAFNPGYSVRSWYGQMDPTMPFAQLVTATGSFAAFQGYDVNLVSCVGNTLTFSAPHHIQNIVPGLTRLWITGATDSGSPTDSCNTPVSGSQFTGSGGGFIVLAAPTPTTLTVALGQTNFVSGAGGGGATGGTATFPNGSLSLTNTIGQFAINSILANGTPSTMPSYASSTYGINGVLTGDMLGATWSAANNKFFGQPFTLSGVTVGLISTNCGPYTINSGNNTLIMAVDGGAPQTVTFSTGSLSSTTIAAAINAAITGVTASSAGNGNCASAIKILANWNGTTSTLSMGAGTGNATIGFTAGQQVPAPTSACLTVCGWATNTFILSPWNLPYASGSGGPAGVPNQLAYYELPGLSATGGTATILPDYSIHHGMSFEAPLLALHPAWAFGNMMECVFERCSGARVYKPQGSTYGYSPLTGLLVATNMPINSYGRGAYITDAKWQEYISLHDENNYARPNFQAISNAGLEIERDFKFFATPALNSPDCTFMIECAARAGATGSVLVGMSIVDAPITWTFALTPYETPGQQIIRKVINAQGIGAITLLAAGTATDTITLQPEDAVVYTFPKVFAGELQQPSIGLRLADVSNATHAAIRWAYDPYNLDAAGNITYCASFPCTLPADLNYRQGQSAPAIFYRIIYMDSSNNVLAKSDVQTL